MTTNRGHDFVRRSLSVLLGCSIVLAVGACRQNNVPADEPTIIRVWCTPPHPIAGQNIQFHARILNRGDQPIAAGTAFCVAFAVDGQPLGAVQFETPTVNTTGMTDVATGSSGTVAMLTWKAVRGAHFVVAALALPDNTFDNNDVLPETSASTMLIVGPPATDTNIRIMPLGDSITGGSHSSTSYRYYLSKALQQDGFNSVIFVGSLHGITDGSPAPDDNWEMDHEGHPGWRADQIDSGTGARIDWAAGKLGGEAGWARVYKPDIVLIDLGLNDLSQGRGPSQTVTSLGHTIDTLRRSNPGVAIILAQVTPEWPSEPGYSRIGELNDRIRILAQEKNRLNSPVDTVDLNSCIDVDRDLVDGVHPNDYGHKKLASCWLPAVEHMISIVMTRRAGQNMGQSKASHSMSR